MTKLSKQCKICEEVKSVNDFTQNKKTGYYSSYCKPCMNTYQKSRKNQSKKDPSKIIDSILKRERIG